VLTRRAHASALRGILDGAMNNLLLVIGGGVQIAAV